jgi:hypothetical protein
MLHSRFGSGSIPEGNVKARLRFFIKSWLSYASRSITSILPRFPRTSPVPAQTQRDGCFPRPL